MASDKSSKSKDGLVVVEKLAEGEEKPQENVEVADPEPEKP